jgi:hypothetical protein
MTASCWINSEKDGFLSPATHCFQMAEKVPAKILRTEDVLKLIRLSA